MDNDVVGDFLNAQREEAPEDLQHYFITFAEYWERKLWHELTDALIDFFNEPQSGPQRLQLFTKFIEAFAPKINQLKLVTLGLAAASQSSSKSAALMKPFQARADRSIADKERLAFLEKLQAKVNDPSSQDAYVYAKAAVASVKLRLKDTEGARKDLDEAAAVLDSFDSVETIVHASFYRVSSDYHQVSLVGTSTPFSSHHVLTYAADPARVCRLLQKCPALPCLHRD